MVANEVISYNPVDTPFLFCYIQQLNDILEKVNNWFPNVIFIAVQLTSSKPVYPIH